MLIGGKEELDDLARREEALAVANRKLEEMEADNVEIAEEANNFREKVF